MGHQSNVGSSLSFDGSSYRYKIFQITLLPQVMVFVVSFDFYSSNLPVDDSGDPNYTYCRSRKWRTTWGIQYAEENGTLRFQVNQQAIGVLLRCQLLQSTWYRIVAQYDKANNMY